VTFEVDADLGIGDGVSGGVFDGEVEIGGADFLDACFGVFAPLGIVFNARVVGLGLREFGKGDGFSVGENVDVCELDGLWLHTTEEELEDAGGGVFGVKFDFKGKHDEFPLFGKEEVTLKVTAPVVPLGAVLDEDAARAVGILGGEGAGVEGDDASVAYIPSLFLVEFNAHCPWAISRLFNIDSESFFEWLVVYVSDLACHGSLRHSF